MTLQVVLITPKMPTNLSQTKGSKLYQIKAKATIRHLP